MLQKSWNRRVIVPAKLRRVRIRRRTFKGTPEQIADALGVQLGPKRSKGKIRRPKGDYVSIKI
jgi:predicted amidophosphoribosyltransferase